MLITISCSSTSDLAFRDYRDILRDGPDRYKNLGGLSKARAHYIDGLILQQKGQHANAVIDFRLALEADTAAAILYSLGESYKRIARNELAVQAYQLAIKHDPEYVLPMESLAEVLMYEGQMDEALSIMARAYDIDPTNERKYMLASIYEYADKKKALGLYRELVNDENVSPFVVSKLLTLYKELDMKDEYMDELLVLYDRNKGNLTYAQDILEEYYTREEYDKGISFLESIDNDFQRFELLELYVTYGDNIYRGEVDRDQKIEEQFMDFIENSGSNTWRIDYLGGLLAGKIEDLPRAKSFFDKVIAKADTISDIPLQIGLFYLDKEMEKDALALFNKYSDIFANDARFPFFSGIIYNQSEDLDEAERMLLKAYRIDTNNVDIITNLGLVYDKRGETEKTVSFYEKAYSIDPDNPLLNNNYAYHLAVYGGNLDRAERMSRYALSRDPDNISYLDTYGWIHYKLGNFNLALQNLERALELGIPSAEVLEHIGDVYMALNKKSKALDSYKASLDLDPQREGLKNKIDDIN